MRGLQEPGLESNGRSGRRVIEGLSYRLLLKAHTTWAVRSDNYAKAGCSKHSNEAAKRARHIEKVLRQRSDSLITPAQREQAVRAATTKAECPRCHEIVWLNQLELITERDTRGFFPSGCSVCYGCRRKIRREAFKELQQKRLRGNPLL